MGVGEQARTGSEGLSLSQDYQAEDQTFICKALEWPGLGLGVFPPLSCPRFNHSLSWGWGKGSEVMT